MQTFRVKLVGSGFMMTVDGVRGRYGFFTSCFVEANASDRAGEAALTLIGNRADLRGPLNAVEGSRASIEIEEVSEWEDDVSGLFLESLMKSLQLVRGGGNEGAV